jgi:hypothetical protein
MTDSRDDKRQETTLKLAQDILSLAGDEERIEVELAREVVRLSSVTRSHVAAVGWRLVPERFTEEMLEAWFNTENGPEDGTTEQYQPRYKAMIDAAPIAPSASGARQFAACLPCHDMRGCTENGKCARQL